MKSPKRVDFEGLAQLVEFQIAQGAAGLVAVGTTGESPTLTWREHNEVILNVNRQAAGRCEVIAGTGSNNTAEALKATRHAAAGGVKAVLLVDPYYNGPSSTEIRREYVAPIAKAAPEVQIIPYIIPGRTGTQLLPEDLAILSREFPNVRCVKEATGSLDNMRRTRACCGPEMVMLSGDDDKTFDMMTDPAIRASGVISVISNVAPAACSRMTRLLLEGKIAEAGAIRDAMKPLFGVVTVKTEEMTPDGPVVCKARNPLAIKALMNILGMPSGPCRQPLGKMTPKGLAVALEAARQTQKADPSILEPVAKAFKVDIDARLNDRSFWRKLTYR